MSIDITSTAMSVASAPTTNNKVSSSSSGIADNASSESSFKNEMTKVSEKKETVKTENKSEVKTSEKTKTELKDSKVKSDTKKEESSFVAAAADNNMNGENRISLGAQINSQQALVNANSQLSNDIAQMIENTSNISASGNSFWSLSIADTQTNTMKFNESDAQFFLNLVQNNDVSSENMVAQAQKMLDSGIDSGIVARNFKVSQALLNALRDSRQNNQPLRIDFDNDISVILRVDRDGALAARFIPGDRAVEQYLKANIASLKATFDEQDLPYSDLSYSNSNKQQNKRRREQKQGE